MNDIVKTMNERIFEIVLEVNAKYAERVDAGASASEQESLLEICSTVFEKLILANGLATEYAEYCNRGKRYRVYRVDTDETLLYVKGMSLAEVAQRVDRIFGAGNDSVDFEVA